MEIASTRKTNLHVDPELWKALRMRALEEGTSATDLLNRIIAAYVGQPAPKKPSTRKGRA